MSSLFVRESLRAELNAYLAALTVPVTFHDTINTYDGITDDTWVTCTFDAYDQQNTCYSGGKKIETGVCDVQVFTIAGPVNKTGDAEGVKICDDLISHFNGFRTGGLVVLSTIPATEYTSGDADRWYGLSVSLEYQFYN